VGEARLVLGDHDRAELATARGWLPAANGSTVHPGDRLRVRSGQARLDAARATRLTLRRGGRITFGRAPVLDAGQLLVETRGARQAVAAGGSTFTVAPGSIARLHRSLDAGTAVYRGRVDIDSAGRRLQVSALRAAAVPAPGLVPVDPSPLSLAASDPWDVQFLGVAIDLAGELDAGSAGFSAQAPQVPTPVVLSLVPGTDGSASTMLSGRRSGEQLISSAIAAAASGPFSSRLGSVLAFHDDGASWGLVVLDQASRDRARVLALVRSAIDDWAGRSGGLTAAIAAASPTPVGSAALSGATPSVPSTSGGHAGSTSTPAGGSGGSGGSALSPVPSPVPTPAPIPAPTPPLSTPGGLSPVTDVIDAIGSALGTGLVAIPSAPPAI